MDSSRTELINMGYGIELADERVVCAAISQEFMTSPSVTGLWQDATKSEIRFFGISREHQYASVSEKGAYLFGDLMIEKFEKSADVFQVNQPRSLIESKRVRLWKPDLVTGNVTEEGRQTARICDDIVKLRRERDALRNDGKDVFLHVLLWGIYEEEENGRPTATSDEPIAFFDELRNRVGGTLDHPNLRWLPLRWTDSGRNPIVRRSLWVALSEIDNPNAESADPD
jgi:hypothetical protein